MKMKFNVIHFILLVLSCSIFNFYMVKAGVPDGIIMAFSISYGMLFPLKTITMEKNTKSGEDSDNENK